MPYADRLPLSGSFKLLPTRKFVLPPATGIVPGHTETEHKAGTNRSRKLAYKRNTLPRPNKQSHQQAPTGCEEYAADEHIGPETLKVRGRDVKAETPKQAQ